MIGRAKTVRPRDPWQFGIRRLLLLTAMTAANLAVAGDEFLFPAVLVSLLQAMYVLATDSFLRPPRWSFGYNWQVREDGSLRRYTRLFYVLSIELLVLVSAWATR
jgi:hypothetical protein